jgi:hypothetical protein
VKAVAGAESLDKHFDKVAFRRSFRHPLRGRLGGFLILSGCERKDKHSSDIRNQCLDILFLIEEYPAFSSLSECCSVSSCVLFSFSCSEASAVAHLS